MLAPESSARVCPGADAEPMVGGGEMVFSEAVMQTEPKTKVAGVDEANEMESKEAEKIGASKCEGLYYLGSDLDIQ